MSARGLISTGLVSLCVIACALLMSVSAFAASAPVLGEESALNVSGDSATLQGEVNPEGSATTYRFEYGTSEAYGQNIPTPEGSVGAGTGMVTVEAHVQGLQPDRTYHYRVVASSEGGTEHGVDRSFTTQRNGGEFTLPDRRQYEMVTPPEKEGALFYNLGSFYAPERNVIQAAVDGGAIVDLASQPTEAEPRGYANNVSVLSTRGPNGWSSRVIAPSRDVVSVAVPNGESEYRLFSEDLSHAALKPFGQFDPLSPDATETTPYLSTEFLNGNVEEGCQVGCFQPLVSSTDDTASPFRPFGEEATCQSFRCGPHLVGASADFSHLFVTSPVQLTSAPVQEAESEISLYEWHAGQLQLASVYPPGEEQPEGYEVGLAGGYFLTPQTEIEGSRRAVSENGERFIFADYRGGVSHPVNLYLRDVAKDETIKLDAPEAGATGSAGGGDYMTASTDDSRVFFLDSEPLTVESSASGFDLYEYDLNAPPGSRLTDLSVDRNTEEAASVVKVLGASDDGSYVYFVAAGALTPNASPSTCQRLGVGENRTEGCNVYVRHDGKTSLVAAGWIKGGDQSAGELARVSPNGRWFAFMSSGSLTGYDNRDAVSGQPDAEVYLYDANTGRLACASCDPTDGRPVGAEYASKSWAAANVPAWTHSELDYAPLYQSRYLSNSGRLFFESEDALVPQDVNGATDVYEYEPEGVPAGEHACTASSVSGSGSEVYKAARSFEVDGRVGEEGAGCLSLISTGTSSGESSFLDASETGGDVFFLTASKLASQDFDNALDVYDAHECTSASSCTPQTQVPPQCDTEASCRAAPTPQPAIFGDPSSATFKGTGNITPVLAPAVKPTPKSGKPVKCKRGFVKRHGRCVRVKSKAKKQAKKSAGKGRK